MALRKQTALVSSDSQQMDENTQDEDSATDRDTGVSSRIKYLLD